ncbi:conjugal transfer protein TraG N-terminal domain-containing protein [Exercitatus varius]|uniref:conjugal transfer protein TraG N-terminal domain-containing protein n=1 Tax=Exercitatus varius TaxID=67857 RepID=UPI00294B38E0|nr:conjugal transfer protein TraG N-terminal domain-containing protein [Exercitatus varius]MDG2961705.1 conjugal transfer protein TraG N-terminal domain-containing protein [Exercitatus varius]
MRFTVDSYLEYFLTLLGWVINNGIFGVIMQTGLFLVPLIVILIQTFIEVKKQGEDEGNKGDLLIAWLGVRFYPAMLVVVLALAPIISISLSNLEYNVERSKTCGYKTPLSPADTGYGGMTSQLGEQSARVPMLWGIMHLLNKGVTHAFVSTIPCQPDLRQVRFEVQHQKINNPALLTEITQFIQQCYIPARLRVKESQLSLTPAQIRETSWLGGSILLSNSQLYPKYRAQQPNKLFPYDAQRDQGLKANAGGGYPRCDDWWANGSVGLRTRLLTDLQQNLSDQVTTFFRSKENGEEALLRALVRAENMEISNGKVYPGYGGNLDPTLTNAVTRLGTLAGLSLGSLAAFPGFDAMRQALPMVQAFMIMAVIIIMPFVITFSGYSLRALVTLIFVNFALVTTTFWWELARWLDSWLLGVLYDSSTHNRINPHLLENTQDDIIVNFVMGSLFIVLPAVWMGAMSWAGVSVGGLVSALVSGSESSQKGGGSAGGQVKNGMSNAIDGYISTTQDKK